jgi:pimeloyl-ACP methyl ester carboxylesterase
MKKAYVDTEAGQIHFRFREGKGTPIICLHQTASSSAMFEAFMENYAGNEPIYALDTPGFGRSYDPDGEPDMREYAQMLIAAIDSLGIDNFHVFGHHTGASIGIEIADLVAERTSSLMMIGPVVLTDEEREQFATVYPKPFEPKADASHLQEMWNYIKSIGPDMSLELQHREMVDTARAWEGHIKVYSQIWNQDFASLYDDIKAPMLIMCSPDDVLWPIFERAKERRPDAKVVELGGSNFQTDEVPEQVASALQDFLQSLNK